jgi:hypothetical protein
MSVAASIVHHGRVFTIRPLCRACADYCLEREQQARSAQALTPAPKSVRASVRYAEIDRTLREIAISHPKNHREVFRALDGRTQIPYAQPFLSAKGWLAGFQANPKAAQAWLSKAWSRLHLPPFPRGPK